MRQEMVHLSIEIIERWSVWVCFNYCAEIKTSPKVIVILLPCIK